MTRFQRGFYSLNGKMFRAVVVMSLLLSMAAILFGFYLYSDTVNREYRVKTWNLANTARQIIDLDETRREAEIVAGVYRAMTEDERAENGSDAYLARFQAVRTEAFENVRNDLQELLNANDAIAAYTAFLDPETNRMIFLADGDHKASFCSPGTWDALDVKYMTAFTDGAPKRLLDGIYETPKMQCIVNNMPQYGYRCTACAKLFDVQGYPVYVFCDTDLNQMARTSRVFLLLYVLTMCAITAVVLVVSILRIRRNVVKPINSLADAARAYIQDKRDGHRNGQHFAKLNIRTGDEIENLSLTMKAMETDLGEYVRTLTRVTAEKERIGTELSIASQIQEGSVPSLFPAFPDRPEFDIYASMTPAKEVGGDFYDFFFVDDEHLAMVIADVSGKGVPAALFMMVTKILINDRALMGGTPAEILSFVNERICENNQADMFVTVWMGIMDVSNGRIVCANAGHDDPALCRADGRFELMKTRHSPVIGAIAGIKYRDVTFEMQPGDKLFLYTDGLPEATDSENNMYEMERMLAALNETRRAEPKAILENMWASVDEFVGSAPQFDDLTMLCLERKDGAGRMKTLTVDAKIENLDQVTAFVDEILESADCPMKTQMQIDLSVEEMFVNIAHYAYKDKVGDAQIHVNLTEDGVTITMTDAGIPYDPLARADPDTTLSAQDRQIGGLGVFLVKKNMDEVAYRRENGRNVLTMRKRF